LTVNERKEDWRIETVAAEVFASDRVFARRGWRRSNEALTEPADYLFAVEEDPTDPELVFNDLRFGGQFVYISSRRGKVKEVARAYAEGSGFVIETGPASVKIGKRMMVLSEQLHYLVLRRTELIRPGEIAQSFTFDVRLVPNAQSPSGYVVRKQIPSPAYVFKRLKEKYPNVSDEKIGASSRQLVDQVFPVLLTREVAFLKILQRDLPANFRHRVPKLVDWEQGPDGYVDWMEMLWLRQGGNTLSQIEFARQATHLLHLVHEKARVIHLDLRLDNMLITPDGVCLIDFGSGVRVGEQFKDTSLLKKIFNELMSTSGVQKVMGRLIDAGRITSSELIHAHRKVDKSADLFYLALQFEHLHKHPDFRGLIRYDPSSEEAKGIRRITYEILRPPDPDSPTIRTCRQLLERLDRLDADLQDEKITLE